jgi:energy-converting hydrogenase A subunit Q
VPTDRAEREVRRALVGNAFLRTLQELLRSRAEREFGSLEERERRLRHRLERKLKRRLKREALRREVRKEVEEALCELVLRVGLEHGADLDRG